jgi:hypothetical protein
VFLVDDKKAGSDHDPDIVWYGRAESMGRYLLCALRSTRYAEYVRLDIWFEHAGVVPAIL